MEDWHRQLVREFVARTPSGAQDERATALEVGFGRAREATAYALELARAHRFAASGCVAGDDVWLQLGEARARFTLNRREGTVVVRAVGEEKRLRWDEAKGSVVDAQGAAADVGDIARRALDALVEGWRSNPTLERSSISPDRDIEFEDEPTKG